MCNATIVALPFSFLCPPLILGSPKAYPLLHIPIFFELNALASVKVDDIAVRYMYSRRKQSHDNICDPGTILRVYRVSKVHDWQRVRYVFYFNLARVGMPCVSVSFSSAHYFCMTCHFSSKFYI